MLIVLAFLGFGFKERERERDDFDGSFGLWLSVKEVCSILLEVRNLWVWLLKYWVFLIDLGID